VSPVAVRLGDHCCPLRIRELVPDVSSVSRPLQTSVYPRGKGRVALANVVNTGQCGVDLCVAHPDLPPARTRNRCIAHALDIQCVPSQLRDAQPALFAPRLTQARRIITTMKGDANNLKINANHKEELMNILTRVRYTSDMRCPRRGPSAPHR